MIDLTLKRPNLNTGSLKVLYTVFIKLTLKQVTAITTSNLKLLTMFKWSDWCSTLYALNELNQTEFSPILVIFIQ